MNEWEIYCDIIKRLETILIAKSSDIYNLLSSRDDNSESSQKRYNYVRNIFNNDIIKNRDFCINSGFLNILLYKRDISVLIFNSPPIKPSSINELIKRIKFNCVITTSISIDNINHTYKNLYNTEDNYINYYLENNSNYSNNLYIFNKQYIVDYINNITIKKLEETINYDNKERNFDTLYNNIQHANSKLNKLDDKLNKLDNKMEDNKLVDNKERNFNTLYNNNIQHTNNTILKEYKDKFKQLENKVQNYHDTNKVLKNRVNTLNISVINYEEKIESLLSKIKEHEINNNNLLFSKIRLINDKMNEHDINIKSLKDDQSYNMEKVDTLYDCITTVKKVDKRVDIMQNLLNEFNNKLKDMDDTTNEYELNSFTKVIQSKKIVYKHINEYIYDYEIIKTNRKTLHNEFFIVYKFIKRSIKSTYK